MQLTTEEARVLVQKYEQGRTIVNQVYQLLSLEDKVTIMKKAHDNVT